MKKLFLLVAIVAMALPSCKKINEAIDDLDNRLDKLEQETIPSIDEQISAINTTLDNLDAMDKELKGYIDGLTATASSLQEQINATNTKIGEVKAALQNEISTAKAEVLAQLDAAKTELENELAQINATIETLKAKDAELEQKIADLRSYVDTELGKTTDWVNATFATLEQYNALCTEIATIKAQIEAINKSITDLESRLNDKIAKDIAAAVATLSADIQQKVSEITTAYTNAVSTAKEEITAAYTAAIATAISNLETSIKAWVGEQLSNYYTIAEVDAKILALQNSIKKGDEASQTQINLLKEDLQTMKSELTTAYQKAIQDAITTNNGVIDSKIANEIAIVNQRIDSEVATINAKISEIEARLDNVEAKIAELLARIQSVSYIPTHSDGKATVKYLDATSQVSLDFEISPKDAVAELASVWQSALSVKAVYTQTRAVSFVNMPVTNFEADTANGVITVTASGENLSAEFFAGTQEASVALVISDGNNSVTSDYIPMIVEKENMVVIYNAEGLSRLASNPTLQFELGAIIDMEDIDWVPVENFSGKLVGNCDKGFKIKNLSAPLFSKLSGEVVNLEISANISESDQSKIGVIATELSGTIDNCEVSGTIGMTSSVEAIAGVVGEVLDCAVISNTTNRCNIDMLGSIASGISIGGIAGVISGNTVSISNCCNYATIRQSVSSNAYIARIAGIVGFTTAGDITIENCENHGIVEYATTSSSMRIYVAGIIATNTTSETTISVTGCKNYGTVQYLGTSSSQETSLGGIYGTAQGGSVVSNCENASTGEVIWGGECSNNSNIAGVVGSTNKIGVIVSSCTNNGKVTQTVTNSGMTHFGGIIGYAYKFSSITGCVNNGQLTVLGTATNRAISVGGVVATARYLVAEESGGSTLKNCANYADLTFAGTAGTYRAGGVVGWNYGTGYVADNSNWANVGNLTFTTTAGTKYLGGVVGQNTAAPIDKVVFYGDIKAIGMSGSVGVIMGVARADATKASNCGVGGSITLETTTLMNEITGDEVAVDKKITLADTQEEDISDTTNPIWMDYWYKHIYNTAVEESVATADGCSLLTTKPSVL